MVPLVAGALISGGLQLIGGIFGGISKAQQEKKALQAEQSRKPWEMSKDTKQTMFTGYNPKVGANIYSLMPLMNPRMAAIMGSRYSNSIYNPGAVAGGDQNSMVDTLRRKVASQGGQQRQGPTTGAATKFGIYK